jgi:hypothetical protein
MAVISNKIHLQEYIYDFAVDGGVKDANIILSNKAGYDPIPVGAIIQSVTAVVVTTVTGSSSTVSWGNASTADGYSGTTIAEGTLVDNFLVNGWDLGASLLWDDTNDHALTPRVADANSGAFVVLISTGNLTAGKIWFGVQYIMPSVI